MPARLNIGLGNLYLVKEFAWTEDDFKVSETMLTYFANFIKTGNLNGDKLPQCRWPNRLMQHSAVMVIDVESKAIDSKDQPRYEFLDKYYKNN